MSPRGTLIGASPDLRFDFLDAIFGGSCRRRWVKVVVTRQANR